jgi:hypothetical protein
VGLERDPLSLVSTIEELLERKSSGSGLENKNYSLRESSAMTVPTSGGLSVGIVRSRAQATEFSSVLVVHQPSEHFTLYLRSTDTYFC